MPRRPSPTGCSRSSRRPSRPGTRCAGRARGPCTGGVDAGSRSFWMRLRALDLGGHLELRGAQLVVQPHRLRELLVERVALGVERVAVAHALGVDVVGVVDEVEGRQREQHAGDAQLEVERRRAAGSAWSRSGSWAGPTGSSGATRRAVPPPVARAITRASSGGVHDEVDDVARRSAAPWSRSSASAGREGEVEKPGEEGRDDVVGDVEGDLHGSRVTATRGQARGGGDDQRRPEAETMRAARTGTNDSVTCRPPAS